MGRLFTALGLTRTLASVAVATHGDAALPLDFEDAGGSSGVDKDQAAYQTVRDAVQKLVDGLNAHPQKAKIAAQIGQAVAKLVAADGHAAKKEWKEIRVVLGEAKTICVAAKKLADDWDHYAKKRAATMAIILAFKTTPNSVKAATDLVTINADGFANSSPPDFANALKILKQIDDNRKPGLATFVKDLKTRLKTVEAADAKLKGYLKPALDEARPLVAESEKALADGEFSLCRQAGISALRSLGPAERRAGRRSEYDTQRAATVKAVEAVRAAPAVADRAKALDALVTKADALAAADTLKIEEGVQVLADAKKRSEVWSGLAKTIATVGSERKLAETDLAALDKHAAAARIATEREAIRKLLADAKNFATLADGAPDPAQGWNSALTNVTRARADLAVAKKLADSMGVAASAETAAGKPGDIAGMKAALAKLRADGKVASKAASAAAADAEFKRFEVQATAAEKALAANDGKAAATALAAAAKELIAAKTIQAEHGEFQTTLASVEAQLKKLQTSPRAAQIKARIDPVAKSLADAKAADKSGKGPEAIATLRAANDAVAAANKADKDRATFDTRTDAAAKRVAATKDVAAKNALQTAIADAKKLADALRFDDAAKAIQQVEVKLDKAKLDGLMTAAKPDQAAITKLAAAMAGNGGEKTVDAMIQAIPDHGSVDLLSALATGRYGVKFTSDKSIMGAGADPAKAMKLVCDMFSKIPQDIVKNKSIANVAYSDLQGGISAGHSYATAEITMKGRAGAVNQDFGSKLKEPDPNNPGTLVDQLPAVEEKCKPANEISVDFISFAAAHEVGHGVDEERGFMKNNGKLPEHGGWITFGGNLQPLADAIGADPKYAAFYKTAEQKQYVLDKLLSKPLNPPAVAPGTPAWNAKNKFDKWHTTATSADVFRRQADSESLKIGDHIYHEAYARVWVGYLAEARKKGLTGYQFRAPGEWFAELYAGYRSGKLKPDHPAVEWLKKL